MLSSLYLVIGMINISFSPLPPPFHLLIPPFHWPIPFFFQNFLALLILSLDQLNPLQPLQFNSFPLHLLCCSNCILTGTLGPFYATPLPCVLWVCVALLGIPIYYGYVDKEEKCARWMSKLLPSLQQLLIIVQYLKMPRCDWLSRYFGWKIKGRDRIVSCLPKSSYA